MLAAKRFFDQPVEEKRKVRRDEENRYGYYDTEHTKNVRDWKEVFDVTVAVPTMMVASNDANDRRITEYVNRWPQRPPELRYTVETIHGCEEEDETLNWKKPLFTREAYLTRHIKLPGCSR